MLYQLRNLSEEEKTTMIEAPLWVALFIGGADGEMSVKEKERIAEVVKVKTYSEKSEVQEIYKILAEKDMEKTLQNMFANLPMDWEERREVLNDHLVSLNKILPKLDHIYAVQYYNSLKSVGVSVANASGGVFGIGAIGESEAEVLGLPMIEKP